MVETVANITPLIFPRVSLLKCKVLRSKYINRTMHNVYDIKCSCVYFDFALPVYLKNLNPTSNGEPMKLNSACFRTFVVCYFYIMSRKPKNESNDTKRKLYYCCHYYTQVPLPIKSFTFINFYTTSISSIRDFGVYFPCLQHTLDL